MAHTISNSAILPATRPDAVLAETLGTTTKS